MLALDPVDAVVQTGDAVKTVARLKDAAQRPVPERTVVFVVAGAGSEFREAVITNHAGEAILDNLALPAGDYTVTAYFGGIPTLDLDDDAVWRLIGDREAEGQPRQRSAHYRR